MTFTNPADRFRTALLFGGVLLLTIFTEHVVTTLPPFRHQPLLRALHDAPATCSETLNLTKMLFATPNLLLTFAAPVAVTGPYGIRRTARRHIP